MGIISALISIALLIYLVLRIVRMVGGTTTTVTVTNQGSGIFDGRPKLPFRTEAEIRQQLDSLPTKWVTYQGATPPLELKIRGLTEELYRRFMRNYFEASGMQEHLDSLPAAQKFEVMKSQLPEVNSRAYVTDWRGAQYPNGQPLPYAPARLAVLMRQDEMLKNFVTEESAKLANW